MNDFDLEFNAEYRLYQLRREMEHDRLVREARAGKPGFFGSIAHAIARAMEDGIEARTPTIFRIVRDSER